MLQQDTEDRVQPLCFRNAHLVTGYALMEHCTVITEGGIITDVFNEYRFPEKNIPPNAIIYNVDGAYIAPGFIDTHIHGSFGYGVEDNSPDSILAMSEHLIKFGVTGFFPTIYTDSEENMIASIRSCVQAKGRETGARILGIHLEGPFISPKQAGAQKADHVKPVDIDYMDRMITAGEGAIITMTVAPEIKNMHQLALHCIQKGIRLQAGHTNAEYKHMIEGMQVGILHSTHFSNAMSPLHHRNPNAVGAILIQRDLCCEIIADGYHVHPDVIRLLLREKPVQNVLLISDALKPAGQEDGQLNSSRGEVYFKNNLFYRTKDNVIAGSALNMMKGVCNLVSYGVLLADAVQMASTNPARIFSLRNLGMLVPGYYADIVVFDTDFSTQMTIVNGKICYNRSNKA